MADRNNVETTNLIVNNNPTVDSVLTCVDETGLAAWRALPAIPPAADIASGKANSMTLSLFSGPGTFNNGTAYMNWMRVGTTLTASLTFTVSLSAVGSYLVDMALPAATYAGTSFTVFTDVNNAAGNLVTLMTGGGTRGTVAARGGTQSIRMTFYNGAGYGGAFLQCGVTFTANLS